MTVHRPPATEHSVFSNSALVNMRCSIHSVSEKKLNGQSTESFAALKFQKTKKPKNG